MALLLAGTLGLRARAPARPRARGTAVLGAAAAVVLRRRTPVR